MKTTAASIAIVVGVATFAWAMEDNYSPFPPSKKPRPFPVAACVDVSPEQQDETNLHYQFAASATSYPRADLAHNSSYQWIVSLQDGHGLVLASNTVDTGFAAGIEAWTADLNADKHPDFVVRTYSGGCGLAASITYVTFLLSKGTEYRAITILCWSAERSDFVDIDHDGSPEFVHAFIVEGKDTKTGRGHSYWVYNLLQFEGADIASANRLDSRFPGWIWYKFRPNHENANHLTAEQRVNLWRKAWTCHLGVDGKPLFPNVEAFAKEQGRAIPKPTKTQSSKRKGKS